MNALGLEERTKKIIKDSSFFEPSKFQSFDKDTANQQMKIRPEIVDEINIRCYGYGYFEEDNHKIQTKIKQNLIAYLKDAVRQCRNVKHFKLDFNGFSVEDRCLIQIIEIIEEFAKDKKVKDTIWIHTRYLRDCDKHTIEDMLELVDCLVKSNYEEVSVKMSGWQFKKEPLAFNELEPFFGNFARNLAPTLHSPLKRFKIDLSSWYMSDLEAYQLLAKAVSQHQMAKHIQAQRNEQYTGKKHRPQLTEEQLTTTREMIERYLTNLDEKYKIENPIPGKGPRYIRADTEFQTRKLRYIEELMNKGIDRQNLRKVYTEERGMLEEHRSYLQNMRQAVEQEEAEQERRLLHQAQIKDLTSELQKQISQQFVKFPLDFVMAERVRSFHGLCILFVDDLQKNLSNLEELELDLRNWNHQFQMKELKKILTKEFAQMGALKLIGNVAIQLIAAPSELNKEAEEEKKSKLKLSFLM